ncbi:MAG: hypothetical protein O2884_12300 [Chloroflexi bacterium]|nr:hypothetical protein [Chloroflexota bacterium]
MLYSEKTAEAAIRAIVKEVDAVAPCSFDYHPRTRAMLVTVGTPEAHAIIELTEQSMVSAFGLNTNPREIDAVRRAGLKRDFEVGGRAARSASAWAKGRYGVGLKKVTIAEYSVATRSNNQKAEAFTNGERMVLVDVVDERYTLWRDASGRMTPIDD